MNIKKTIVRLDRVLAWSLVALFVAFFVTGYGSTKGIMPPELGKFLHDNILPIPGAIAFALHSAYGMHVAFKRWKVWNRAWQVGLIVYCIAIVTGAVIFQAAVKNIGSEVQIPQALEL